MLFLGFVPMSELELNVKSASNQEIEYYYSLEEMYEYEGLDVEYTLIYLNGVSCETLEGHKITFSDVHSN